MNNYWLVIRNHGEQKAVKWHIPCDERKRLLIKNTTFRQIKIFPDKQWENILLADRTTGKTKGNYSGQIK